MNILFIFSLQDIQTARKPLKTQLLVQFGISYISALLKKYGYNTKLLVLSRTLDEKNKEIVDEYVKKFSPQLICFTAVYSEYDFIANIAKYIKRRYPDIYLLIGGCHVSLNPEEISLEYLDALCIGEGEYPTLELVSKLEKGLHPSGISNLWIKHRGGIERNPTRSFLKDLDSLPFPDREMWQDWIREQPDDKIPVLLGRGCPFECTYCCNRVLKKISKGPYVRFRSPENILDEIRYIVSRFPRKKEIYLEVESFAINKEWAIEVCSELERFNKTLIEPLSFGVNIRITPNVDLEDLFVACKRSNFKYLHIGLESGSEKICHEILKRDYSNQDIVDTVKLARKYDLKVVLYNLIGIPGETLDDFKETINLNRICLPDGYFLSIFFPYPGTELYSLCKKMGLLEHGLNTEMERHKAVLDLPGFSKKQILQSYARFERDVYKGTKPIYKVLVQRFILRLRANYYLEYLYRKLVRLAFFKWLKDKLE